MSGARLGLGLAAVGRPAYINLGRRDDLPADRSVAAMASRTVELLDAATALGIDYIDTARSYGRAEEFLAGWLDHTGATPFVASKWGYRYTADWRSDVDRHEVKEHSAEMFEQQRAASLELLGPRLRLYQVHSLTLDSPLWTDTALLVRLTQARADHGFELGFSTSGPTQPAAIRRGMELYVDGARLFDSVQSTWNLLEPSAGPALLDAASSGMRVVLKEALANGRLTDRGVAATSPLAAAAADRGVGIDALALAAALAQPFASVVLSGAASVAQLTSNAQAVTTAATLDPVEFTAAEPPERYWATRSALAWQ